MVLRRVIGLLAFAGGAVTCAGPAAALNVVLPQIAGFHIGNQQQ